MPFILLQQQCFMNKPQLDQRISSPRSPRYTRYNLSFRPSNTNSSLKEFKKNKSKRYAEFGINQKSYDKEPNTHFSSQAFTTYKNFPLHLNRFKENSKSSIEQSTHKELKWIGIKGVNQYDLDHLNSSKNAFPQRKTKGSDQLIINMLLKYQKHYARQQEGNLSTVKSSQKQDSIMPGQIRKRQKYLQRPNWFKMKQKKAQSVHQNY